jgi:threonine dehydrogenase-like Zn-dependent dehydrogenase
VPLAEYNTIPVGAELPDEQYLFLSDILPTAWQGVQYADVPDGGILAVSGLGPVGQLTARIGAYLGYRVIAIDPVAERRAMAERHGVETFNLTDDVVEQLRDRTAGRGPDSVVDAVGMEAHGNPIAAAAQTAVGILPNPVARAAMEHVGFDRLDSMLNCLELVRRGGTVSIAGVYGGVADPLPMKSLFDKGVTIRMGQCNVKRWVDELLPLVEDSSDPLGLADLVTHTQPLENAPRMYEIFQKKEDGCIKVVLKP